MIHPKYELERALGPTVRPLQGIDSILRGNSCSLKLNEINKVVVESRTSTDDSEMIAMSLGLTVDATIDGSGPYANEVDDIVAHLTWGTGGAVFDADIDWLNGLTLSVPANTVRVSASYFGQAGAGGLSTVFQAGAGLAYGSWEAFKCNPRRTIKIGAIANNASVSIPIPNFATAFEIQASGGAFTPPGGTIAVDLSTGAAAAPEIASYAVNVNLDLTYSIPGSARLVNIKNTTGGNLQNISVVFLLSI